MEGLEVRVDSLGAGWRPSPEMLPHPWYQQPFWVSGPWLSTASPLLFCLPGHRDKGLQG